MLSTFCRHASRRRNAQVPKGPLRMGCTRVCQRVKTKGFGGTDLSDPPLHPRVSIMILPQVHLRKPCYDFYFL